MNISGVKPINDPKKIRTVAVKHPVVPAYPGSAHNLFPINTKNAAIIPPGIPKSKYPIEAIKIPADASGEHKMYVEIIGIIVIFVALRALITQNRAEKLLYLNVIGFGVSALIALVINTPFALVVAAAFFICSTISANAIAYTLKRLDDEVLLE